MKKLIISGGIAVITIPCLCYYVTKYYIYRTLTFEQSMMVMFTIICTLMIFAISSNFYNSYQTFILKKQNLTLNEDVKELNEEIKELKDIIEQYHYDNIEYHEDNRELLLDLDKGDR